MARFLRCPAHPQQTANSATLHANLRVEKYTQKALRFEAIAAQKKVFGQALTSEAMAPTTHSPCAMLPETQCLNDVRYAKMALRYRQSIHGVFLGIAIGRTLAGHGVFSVKTINDNHGHATGAAAHVDTGTLISKQLAASEVCGSLGSEEFAVLLVNADTHAAAGGAEKIRAAVAATPLATHNSIHTCPVTPSLSIGVSSGSYNRETLMQHADSAMYGAKRACRNQVTTRVK